jgi:peptide/nickel transport system substrate-binding protein
LLSAAAAVSAAVPFSAMAQSGATFVLASNTEVDNLDPHTAAGNIPTAFFINVYDSLVRVRNSPPEIQPGLASAWQVSADGFEYTFTLVPDAVFHDGSPLDAEAVRYSFARILRIGKGASWMISDFLSEDGIEIVDAHTIRFKLSAPFAAFLQVLPWMFVVNPTVAEANKGDDDGQTYFTTNVAGSGAFELTRYEAGTLYGFTRFAGYWSTGGGNVQNVVWRIVRETSTQRLLLERGEVHFVLDLTTDDLMQLRGKPGVVEVEAVGLQPFYLRMNTRHGPLADVNVRKAISYAFNYQGMLDVMGNAGLMIGPLPTGVFGHNPDLAVYRTDIEAAKAELAKSAEFAAGGFTLSFTHVSGYDHQRRLGLVMLDALAPLNINVEIKSLVWPDLVAAAQSPETQGDFMAVYESANYADPDNFAFAGYHSSRNGTWTNPVYANPRVDELIMAGRSEADPEKRKAVYFELQQLIVDDAPDIFGVLERRPLVHRDNLTGYAFTPIGTNAPEFFPLSIS